MIFLFTDFGSADLYVGQVRAMLAMQAPRVPVIDLIHDVPAFSVKAGAHLLAALSSRIPAGSVTMAVVDPGVGGTREPVAIRCDRRWFVGPDNGLLSVLAARANRVDRHAIGWRPDDLSVSFHGRDLFAPVAAMLATRRHREARLMRQEALRVEFGAEDLPEVIYADHYGNLATGLRASNVPTDRTLTLQGQTIPYARVFSEAAPGSAFWYQNSLGLVEVAVNGGSALQKLGFAPRLQLPSRAVRDSRP